MAQLRGETRTFSGTTPQVLYTPAQFASKTAEGKSKAALAGAQYPYNKDQIW
jgi:hypothetical protein